MLLLLHVLTDYGMGVTRREKWYPQNLVSKNNQKCYLLVDFEVFAVDKI